MNRNTAWGLFAALFVADALLVGAFVLKVPPFSFGMWAMIWPHFALIVAATILIGLAHRADTEKAVLWGFLVFFLSWVGLGVYLFCEPRAPIYRRPNSSRSRP